MTVDRPDIRARYAIGLLALAELPRASESKRDIIEVTTLLGAVFVAGCLAVSVSDGDTIRARCGEPGAYEKVKVRIGAIDAPEKGQPFGPRAKEAISDLAYMKSVKRDSLKLDRHLRHVWIVSTAAVGAVGLALVRAGMAWWYREYAREQTRAARELYEGAQRDASNGRCGLWTEASADAPWEGRRGRRSAASRTGS